MHEYECFTHSWPSGPNDTSWRCPGCAMDSAIKETRGKAKLGLTARLSDSSGHAWDVIRKRIRERDNYHCRMCRRPIDDGEVDHIKPLEQGGSNADDNLQLLCRPCHKRKTATDRGYVQRTGWRNGVPTNPSHHWNTEA